MERMCGMAYEPSVQTSKDRPREQLLTGVSSWTSVTPHERELFDVDTEDL